MSFDIVFMYNNEPMNKISKNPETLFTLSGTLRDESSIVDPVILVEHDDPISANYAYIAQFRRYYYIKNIESVRTKLWRITMHCDVLKTFSEGILSSPCIVAKSSSRYNLYLNDPDYKCVQQDIIMTQDFPSGFNIAGSYYVLTILGEKSINPNPPSSGGGGVDGGSTGGNDVPSDYDPNIDP